MDSYIGFSFSFWILFYFYDGMNSSHYLQFSKIAFRSPFFFSLLAILFILFFSLLLISALKFVFVFRISIVFENIYKTLNLLWVQMGRFRIIFVRCYLPCTEKSGWLIFLEIEVALANLGVIHCTCKRVSF